MVTTMLWRLFVTYLAARLLGNPSVAIMANFDPALVHFFQVCTGTLFWMHVMAEVLHRYWAKAKALLDKFAQAFRRWWR